MSKKEKQERKKQLVAQYAGKRVSPWSDYEGFKLLLHRCKFPKKFITPID